MRSPIRVLVIDDSAARQVLTAGLAADPAFEVVGSAADPYEASEKILRLLPDVVTLDVDLPRMNGVEFLRRLMPRFPLPVVMVSALTQRGNDISLQALDAGAIDVVTKPALDRAGAVERMLVELRTKLKIAAIADVGTWERGVATRTREIGVALEEPPEKLIAIGASTGGPEALKVLLTRLPARGPAVLVVQHMPPGFTQMFAERLDEVCALPCREARDRRPILPGHVYVAPGDRHLAVVRIGDRYFTRCLPARSSEGPCPAIDVLFKSMAVHAGRSGMGIVLTGMGRDGADGLLEMRRAGARTLVQDEASSIVYGMPREALMNGAAERAATLDDIAASIVRFARARPG